MVDEPLLPSAVAAEALALLGTGRQVAPFSSRAPGFDLAAAYRAAGQLRAARVARGERPVGRKIGFTNRTIWPQYGVCAPIWGDVWDSTVRDLPASGEHFALVGLAEPRLEPEVVFGLSRAPAPGMDDAALLAGIEWVALGFEVVQSIFPGWRFQAADTVAAYGMHAALLIGRRQPVSGDLEAWREALRGFEIELRCDGEPVDRGTASNVLDGPVPAVRHLVEALAQDPSQPPLAAGEILTTGTLTRVWPVAPGQRWETRVRGVALADIGVRFD
ncbi:2-keto-4-pentenoate hydratase [Sorangium sp. So ce131]|uniref:2-keto-4-pentenoate hydratase n=1 Tax=Sorangium sp. So ce131 TaxID=3133282 RepID=UPI003F63DC1E